jgi:hypothetical protein
MPPAPTLIDGLMRIILIEADGPLPTEKYAANDARRSPHSWGRGGS